MARFPACPLMLSLLLVGFAGAQEPAITTLKAKTKIVVIDVVVTGKDGKPVKDLKASDFALAENGAPQTISHFDAHTSLATMDSVKLAETPKLEPNVFTNYSRVPAADGPLNVLLLDKLNTPVQDQAHLNAEILKYLKSQTPGTRMAIFGLGNKLTLLQGFTSDPAILKMAIETGKNGARASFLNGNAITGAQDPDQALNDFISSSLGGESAQALQAIKAGDSKQKSMKTDLRTQKTLDAMSTLAGYLSAFPGRKNLMWFSGSFPISLQVDPKALTAISTSAEFANEYRRMCSQFAKDQVAVYPINARGLVQDPNMDASHMDTANTPGGAGLRDQLELFQDFAKEYETMNEIATDTGGKMFVNTNGLADALKKVIDLGSNYYTLTYTPANRDWKGEFRKVQVKLADRGYKLEYRPGYYAEDADEMESKDAIKVADSTSPAMKALSAAMAYGSPEPENVVLKVAVNPATGQPEDGVAKRNLLAPKVTGPFERYVLQVAALPQAFTFMRDVPGKIHMAARLVTCVYTADGALTNTTTLNVIGDIDDARYQTIMANGVQFKQEISVPLTGESFLRIGVQDMATNHVGVVQIPVATVAKLKPLGQVVK